MSSHGSHINELSVEDKKQLGEIHQEISRGLVRLEGLFEDYRHNTKLLQDGLIRLRQFLDTITPAEESKESVLIEDHGENISKAEKPDNSMLSIQEQNYYPQTVANEVVIFSDNELVTSNSDFAQSIKASIGTDGVPSIDDPEALQEYKDYINGVKPEEKFVHQRHKYCDPEDKIVIPRIILVIPKTNLVILRTYLLILENKSCGPEDKSSDLEDKFIGPDIKSFYSGNKYYDSGKKSCDSERNLVILEQIL
ncbi:unnamed protein product [Orchesella dallaii]|uniref:Spindle and kinetochore-associated protein 3 n=1 Tax=Orchesella dallaii TaxID=48710 RepID=A0ABP1Q1P4_9HEXA